MYLPGSDDCLDARLELDDADLCRLVERNSRYIQGRGQTCEAVRLILVVERVQDFDYMIHD